MALTFSAACFDLDGTLVDTEPLHIAAEDSALSVLGLQPSDKRRIRTFGMGIERGLLAQAQAFGVDRQLLYHEYLRGWEDSIGDDGNLRAMDGAVELVIALHSRGIPLGLVTSGDRTYADGIPNALNLRRAFSTTVVSDDVTDLKPHPGPYLLAARLLGTKPESVVVFEDSESGVKAAKEAGAFTVAVHPDWHSRPGLEQADVKMPRLNHVSAKMLNEWFSRGA